MFFLAASLFVDLQPISLQTNRVKCALKTSFSSAFSADQYERGGGRPKNKLIYQINQ